MTVVGAVTATGEMVGVSSVAGLRIRALWLELQAYGETTRALFELPHKPLVVHP